MKLSIVLSAVNSNPAYYMFITKQILFWGSFNIKNYSVFIGSSLPEQLKPYSNNIILFSKNLDMNDAYVSQKYVHL